MSFDINFGKNLSNIQASSKTSDGGAGNTGYFQREGEQEGNNLLGFAKDYPNDSFEKVELPEENQEQNLKDLIFDIFSSIINFIKNLLFKIFKK